MKTGKPSVMDEHFAPLPEAHRAALQRLRNIVKSVAPQAEECISYGLPAFSLGKKKLVAFGAWNEHCALYPMSAKVLEDLADELKEFSTSKGTIRFKPDQPLPEPLVRRIVQARMRETGVVLPEADLPKIGQPALRALNNAGFFRLEQLTSVTEAELAKLHGMGPKALGLLRQALAARGLAFKR